MPWTRGVVSSGLHLFQTMYTKMYRTQKIRTAMFCILAFCDSWRFGADIASTTILKYVFASVFVGDKRKGLMDLLLEKQSSTQLLSDQDILDEINTFMFGVSV